MRYAVMLMPKAKKQLGKLSQEARERIIAKLERIRIRPHAFVKRLVASPFFALRTGDYRIIMDIRDGELLILVLEVGRRDRIYE